ncbi:MAG: PSD1 and planctomycete cytochrome C domain-containing protein [Verrucomicrobiales bacterium]|nr:PSD1 and planctomycete cytochrome C domain-containing protein [Verrucomicrobiales bacterium]
MNKKLPVLSLLVCFGSFCFGVDFNRDVRPILSDKCFACHGFDEHDRKADLRLDTAAGALADLGGYAAIVPGDLEKSEAWYRIISDDEDELMPPPKFHKPLTEKEKSLIKAWIEEGAEYKTHWSYAPLEKKEVPSDENLIDHYIGKDLLAAGLQPSPAADPLTLVRRLYFDLLGLPPTPEEVDRFVNQKSPDAYRKLVGDLLADPAFGERMAVYWLDLVRYADTIGYHSDNFMEVSAYRDYVISAFNRNLPYDQFTIEQLAGDLLPEPTLEQLIASGYNRLLQSTEEGGAQAAEYMVIHAADRVRNVSGVWLGSTIGCAQCHDHKYDPFTARDFYTMAAFFADIKEKPIGKRQPNLQLPTEAETREIAQLEAELAENSIESVLAEDGALKERVDTAQVAWESELRKQLTGGKKEVWKVVKPVTLKSTGGQTLKILDDQSVITSGANPARDNYLIDLKSVGTVTAIRLEALSDSGFPRKSLSRSNGNFILSGIKVTHQSKPVKVASAQADFEQKSWPVAAVLDGKNQTGWAVNGHQTSGTDRVAMFVFESPVILGDSEKLTIELQHQAGHAGHNIGKFRLSVTDSLNPGIKGKTNLPGDVLSALKKAPGDKNDKEKALLRDYFRSQTPLLAEVVETNQKTKAKIDAISKGVKTMLVSESLAEPRMTRLLHRGDWLDKTGEMVEPALPAFLPRGNDLPSDRRGNRLDLAKWIVEPGNPLTSRTMVNRIWMLLFGQGLSRNVDDLGGQGEPPTHPELLDQLSISFRDSGWDIKALITQIVMSDTYRQVSTVTPELLKADPTNLLWGRQGRWRLEAEFVRDTALHISGLLVEQEGGKSVKPYQPAGYWQHLNFPRRKWEAGQNDELYRRGLYTFRCRSFPHPAMVSFDAPSREECTSQRSRSNIPQQALVMLNDPSFVEASRVFSERFVSKDASPRENLKTGWRLATGRVPGEDELNILVELFNSQRQKYLTRENAAKDLLTIGESRGDKSIPLPDAAAYTQVARAILNSYETISRN